MKRKLIHASEPGICGGGADGRAESWPVLTGAGTEGSEGEAERASSKLAPPNRSASTRCGNIFLGQKKEPCT